MRVILRNGAPKIDEIVELSGASVAPKIAKPGSLTDFTSGGRGGFANTNRPKCYAELNGTGFQAGYRVALGSLSFEGRLHALAMASKLSMLSRTTFSRTFQARTRHAHANHSDIRRQEDEGRALNTLPGTDRGIAQLAELMKLLMHLQTSLSLICMVSSNAFL